MTGQGKTSAKAGDFSQGRVSLVIMRLGLPMMLAEWDAGADRTGDLFSPDHADRRFCQPVLHRRSHTGYHRKGRTG